MEYNGVNTELNGAHNGAKSLNIQYPLHGLQRRLTELYTESLTDPNGDKRRSSSPSMIVSFVLLELILVPEASFSTHWTLQLFSVWVLWTASFMLI